MSVVNHVHVIVTCGMPEAGDRVADVARTCGLVPLVSPVGVNGWQTVIVPTSGGKEGRGTADEHNEKVRQFVEVVRWAGELDLLWGCTVTVLTGVEFGPLRTTALPPKTPGRYKEALNHPAMKQLLKWQDDRREEAEMEEQLRRDYSWGM